MKNKTFTDKNCIVCGTIIPITRQADVEKRKTCSTKCRRKLKTCIMCKNRFYKPNVKTCSPECKREHVNEWNRKRLAKETKKNQQFRSKAHYEALGNGSVKFEDKVLTLKNYKEPLLAIEKDKGFGWYGTVAMTLDSAQIQCHVCGRFYESLVGHVNHAHKINVKEYKEKFGLQYSTALISENIRMKEKQRMLDYIKSLSQEEKEAYRSRASDRFKEFRKTQKPHGHKKTLEAMNKDASCPDQVLDQIKKIKEKIGHVPSKNDFINETGSQRYIHLAYKQFGSWNKAIEMCKFDKVDDHRANNMGGKNGNGRRRKYTDDELLEYLRIYAEENRQIPTVTDFKRGLLPEYSRYTSRFGTIENARQLAGVYEIIHPHEDVTFNKSKSKYWRKFVNSFQS